MHLYRALASTLVLTFANFLVPTAAAQGNGALAAYSFEDMQGSAADLSGSGNTLDLLNGTASAAGKYGSAASFDGSNDLAVARAYNASLNLTGNNFTLSAWIFPRSNGAWQMIVNKPSGNSHVPPYFDWSMHREISTGRIVAFLGCNGGQLASSSSTPLNAWTHVAVTYDGGSVRHYINGTLNRTTSVSCAIRNTSSQRIRVGANGGGGEVLNGSVDDVRVYGRVLSAAEIQADMNSSLGSGGSTPPPAADTTPPSVTISSPANGSSVSGTVTVSASASDNTAIAGVRFRLDGANLGNEDLTAPYSISWPSASSANGSHSLTAVARDTAGNSRTSAAVAVTVANSTSTPTVGVALSASPSSGTVPLNGVDLTASLSGSATGSITYTFYCNRSDTSTSITQPWSRQITGSTQTTISTADVCNYSASGSYTAKVIATRNGVSAQARTTISVGAAAAPAVSLNLSATPTSVPSGGSSNLTWSATNATSCTASGAWSGSKPTSGSAATQALSAPSTFTLNCSGSGTPSVSRSATVAVTGSSGSQSGLDFQGSAATTGTVRFRFTNPLAIYPATYIWKVRPRQQNGYYTAFFWGNDGSFYWDRGSPNSYYGAHPYPSPAPNGSVHHWELSVAGGDFQSAQTVEYGRWHTQALRVWSDGSGKHHEFYWDLPDTSKVIRRDESSSYGNNIPPNAALTWGDAPWNASNEIMNGVLRGIQIYSTLLSSSDMLAEASSPRSTGAGTSNMWYMNLNPTPGDISDKSGAGHNPAWVGSERPLLWTGP
jgi:hypothetical protein